MKKTFKSAAVAMALAGMFLAGCSKNNDEADTKATITFVSQMNSASTWNKYIEKFNRKYPNIKVKIKVFKDYYADYSGVMSARLNSSNYGDVLMIPTSVSSSQLSKYFVPLGDVSKMSREYSCISGKSYDGKVYGIPSMINVDGLVINKAVFERAGITTFPKTTDEFVSALEKIKETQPDVVPIYSNYSSGWALAKWDFMRLSASGDAEFNSKLVKTSRPFSKGQPMYSIYKTLYDVADKGLIEKKPKVSDWNNSCQDLADGKIGCMVLGSWALNQIKALNEQNASQIVMAPFPSASGGRLYSSINPDYCVAVSRKSREQKAALIFAKWLAKSTYAEDSGGLSPINGKKTPESFETLKKQNVTLLQDKSTTDVSNRLRSIDEAAGTGLDTSETTKQDIIDAGLKHDEKSFEGIMNKMNDNWAKAVAKNGN